MPYHINFHNFIGLAEHEERSRLLCWEPKIGVNDKLKFHRVPSHKERSRLLCWEELRLVEQQILRKLKVIKNMFSMSKKRLQYHS